MNKPKKTEIAAKLEEWARNERKRLRIEADRDLALEPHVTALQKKLAPINEDAEEKLAPVLATKARLEKEITDAMQRGISVDGEVALPQVVTERAIVEVKTTTQRDMDAKAFFDAVKAGHRTSEFFGCLKVLIGKVEKYRSDLLKLAKEKRSHSIVIRLLS